MARKNEQGGFGLNRAVHGCLLVLCVGSAVLGSSCAHPTVTSERAQAMVHQGALLLDVRSPGEFAEGHLAGAVNVPVQELEATLPSLSADKNREIVVYCRSGMRSSRARGILLKAGFAKVEDLGGMSNWK